MNAKTGVWFSKIIAANSEAFGAQIQHLCLALGRGEKPNCGGQARKF
jgi:hypothetical protein